jgi:hypothetical protein
MSGEKQVFCRLIQARAGNYEKEFKKQNRSENSSSA